MTEKLRPCPFCGGEARLQLTDDEGNFKDESYLENPYSGVGYVIVHDISNSVDCCPTCKHGVVPIPTYRGNKYYPRCPFCGQKLKGDDEDDC